jgi:hypothetical protein
MSNSMKAASMLARVASDAEFRNRFKADPVAVASECGVELHPHGSYDFLQDDAGLRNIVVTDEKHGSADIAPLPSAPTVGEVRRWVVTHVHAGDATGNAIQSDVNAAISAAGASAPRGMKFAVAVDDSKTMHIVIPPIADSEVSLEAAAEFSGAGVEAVDTNTTQTVEAETTEVTVTETTVAQDMEAATTVVAVVELAVVPGFIT